MFLGIVCTYNTIGCHGNHPGRWYPSGELSGLAPAMYFFYFLTLVRIISADFLDLEPPEQAKNISFIFWS